MINKTNYTQGPWTAEYRDTFPVSLVVRDKHHMPIAYISDFVSNSTGEDWADGRMIAESPNMIEFICDLVSACDYGTETLSDQFKERAIEIIRKVYGKGGYTDEQ